MKKIVLLFFVGCVLASVNASFGQGQTGELERFTNEELTPANEIKLYPNPAIEYLKVRISNSTIKAPRIVIHTIIGSVVEADIRPIGASEYMVKVKDLSPGYYLVAIRDDQGSFKETYKFLKR